MDAHRFNYVDGVNEAVFVDVHAEAGQMPCVTQRRETLTCATLIVNISVDDVQMIISCWESVFSMPKNHLNFKHTQYYKLSTSLFYPL